MLVGGVKGDVGMNTEETIHIAVSRGDVDQVASLLRAKPRLARAYKQYDGSPLHVAGSPQVARLLISAGANVNVRGWMGASPLHTAANRGAVNVAEVLIDAGARINARRTERLDTPLHWAANAETAALLLDRGADIEGRDWAGRTPLHWAAQFGRSDTIRLLLHRGAEVNAQAILPSAPAYLPRRFCMADLWFLILAASHELVAALTQPRLRENLYFSEARYDRKTPLHWAAQEGHPEGARLLLEHGAEVNATDRDGRTPLHAAAFRGHIPLIDLLLDSGADATLRSAQGDTPLHEAKQHPEAAAAFTRLLDQSVPGEQPTYSSSASMGLRLVSLCMVPAANEIITVSRHALLNRWECGSTPSLLAGIQTEHSRITGIAILPGDDEFVAATSAGLEVRRRSDLCRTGGFTIPVGDGGPVTAVDVSTDGRWLVVADARENVFLLEWPSGREINRLDGGEQTLDVRFSPCGRLLATACSFQGGGFVRIDRLETDGRRSHSVEFQRNDYIMQVGPFVDTLMSLRFSADGRFLVLFETSAVPQRGPATGWRGNVVLYDVVEEQKRWCRPIDADVTGDRRSLANVGYPLGFITNALFVDDQTVACGTTGGVVLLLSAVTGQIMRRAKLRSDSAVTVLAWDKNTSMLWAGLDDGKLVEVPIQ